jgi:hypothetical protein
MQKAILRWTRTTALSALISTAHRNCSLTTTNPFMVIVVTKPTALRPSLKGVTDDFAKAAGLSKSAAQRHLARNKTTLTGGAKSACNTARARRDSLADARAQFQALALQLEEGHAAFLEKAARREGKARPPASNLSGNRKPSSEGQARTLSAFPGEGIGGREPDTGERQCPLVRKSRNQSPGPRRPRSRSSRTSF